MPQHAASTTTPPMRFGSAILLFVLLTAIGAVRSGARAQDSKNALEQYRSQLITELSGTLANARLLRERATAGDLQGAKNSWIAARTGWERAEVFINGFVSDVDDSIDAWPNALSGFHAIEVKLFGANSTDVGPATDQLIYQLTDLDIKIRQIPLNSQGLLNGAARLAYEVGESKADGGESRYSGTSLDDMRNNISGIQFVYETLFAAPLKSSDPKLEQITRQNILQLQDLLSVPDAKNLQSRKIRAASEELIVALQSAAPKMGLVRPTLEDITQ
jgi:iron uptake system component EfeO